tara:strand:+ start:50 stop:196 length:147 start_codon:yes stop_codon:yes gene_type:complete
MESYNIEIYKDGVHSIYWDKYELTKEELFSELKYYNSPNVEIKITINK